MARKYVFSHYMVCIPTRGGRSTVEDCKHEIMAALERGIDGFALNGGCWTIREPHYKKRTRLLYQATAELRPTKRADRSLDLRLVRLPRLLHLYELAFASAFG